MGKVMLDTRETGRFQPLWGVLLGGCVLYGCGQSSSPEAPALTTPEPASAPSVVDVEVPLPENPDVQVAPTTDRPVLLTESAMLERLPKSEAVPLKPVEHDQRVVGAFQKLVVPLESVEDWERVNQALLNFGQEAVPYLSDRLTVGNNIERETAATTLVSMGPDAANAIPALRKGLQDEIAFVRANCAVVLVQFPDEVERAVPVLVKLLSHSDSALQQMAAMNLAVLGDEARLHVAELAEVLKQRPEDQEVLLPVVQLLGRIGPAASPAIPELKQIAFEKSGEVKEAATSAIQLIETGNKQ